MKTPEAEHGDEQTAVGRRVTHWHKPHRHRVIGIYTTSKEATDPEMGLKHRGTEDTENPSNWSHAKARSREEEEEEEEEQDK